MLLDEKVPIWIYILLIMILLVFMYHMYIIDMDTRNNNCIRRKNISSSVIDNRSPLEKEADIIKLKSDIAELNSRSYKTTKVLGSVIEGFIKGAFLGLVGSYGNATIVGKSAVTWAIMPILFITIGDIAKKTIMYI